MPTFEIYTCTYCPSSLIVEIRIEGVAWVLTTVHCWDSTVEQPMLLTVKHCFWDLMWMAVLQT
jgi:hypothetical protein